MLLRSDGCAVGCGRACSIPYLEPGKRYVGSLRSSEHLVLRANFAYEAGGDVVSILCSTLSGDDMLRLNAGWSDLAWDIYKSIARELNVNLQTLQVVLPDGQLLAKVCHANPEATIADLVDVS